MTERGVIIDTSGAFVLYGSRDIFSGWIGKTNGKIVVCYNLEQIINNSTLNLKRSISYFQKRTFSFKYVGYFIEYVETNILSWAK